MPDPSASLAVLSLFTTPERAAEIEGDLIEQAQSRGSLWYASQIAVTTLALFRASVFRNFFVLALMSYAAYELSAKSYFFGFRPLRWYLQSEGVSLATVTWLTYTLVAVFTFIVGAGLVRLVPRLGAQVAIGAITLFLLRLFVLQEGFTITQLALCVALPMFAGVVVSNRQCLVRGS